MGHKRPAEKNPALWRFGAELTRLRNLAEMSQRTLAYSVHVSPQQVGAVERGERYPSRAFAQAADRVLGGEGVLVEIWPQLHGGAPPEALRELVKAEPVATMVREYNPLLVPGLVQTENYAGTILRAGNPLLGEEELTKLISARTRRRSLLNSTGSPIVWLIVDEVVIKRPVGPPETVYEQIGLLLDLIEQRRIRFQVVPFSTRHHPGLSGPFKILSFNDKPDAVYVETVAQGEMVAEPELVGPITLLFSTLQGVALSPEQTVELLRQRRDEIYAR
ncbi:helix-turn-helix domain-containing protein [Spiractinospora alimapuensis]|uniref:helix-turn-helix domain-containing protein n=1 Tax=Spiractinospora alimapuensis TaxID=2820884 RepID=UPI001F2EE9E4|nr:helix-turn-helix transcriptional regulator [Spiractinospora alimapuensis]QVQ50678.1 helix-turn-helix domain-containing protein [Spiractinospora alimapuensis]